ncbi:hypothetical protein HIM_01386 [Hirsutella minnesotensis 3608]|nr:hypothetical protein HIM_01386 [Hirsutella minnesotensis 3608]
MGLYSDPPALLPFRHDKPTLLVCWWATSFCSLMIIFRVTGRFIRTERLFREDRIAALALMPLILRMVCVHFILIYGTNNADFTGVNLTATQIHQRSIGSGLLMASRFFYASTLWIFKFAILEFLRRLTDLTWQRAHKATLIAIRWTLAITFIAIFISQFAECQPFAKRWQVLPDPGGQCRQGYVQLLTLATCNIATDALLVIFPIPIILQSHMRLARKVQLIILFSLSLSVVAVTIYRVPHTLWEHGRQQYRSLLASVELIFATAAANALVLGALVRDRGFKKPKFHRPSVAESYDYASSARRPTLHHQWGSDEDLVRDVGIAVDPSLRGRPGSPGSDVSPLSPISRAPIIFPSGDGHEPPWQHDQQKYDEWRPVTGRKLSFFDVGGLLGDSPGSRDSNETHFQASRANPFPASVPAGTAGGQRGVQRGSTALLQDLGGYAWPRNGKTTKGKSQAETELQTIPQSRPLQDYDNHDEAGPKLMDPGGLLS